jgi:predicted transposase/invertase (TIGR01784 family)
MQESVTYQALLEEGREEGREEGDQGARRAIARNLIQEGCDMTFIARVAGLSLEEIRQLEIRQS